MIKKLRLKFVAINMGIVTIMLCVILGLVYYFTRANLETENLNMMRAIASQPLIQQGIPSEPGEDVRLPFFTLQLGPRGEVTAAGGSYYDLSDTAFLEELVQMTSASPRDFGVIEEYNLRYYRAATPFSISLVFSDISSERATLAGLLRTCLAIGILGFLVFLGISILLSRWAVRPVDLAWRQQRRFVADASHELKTPLAVIMTNAELLQSGEYGEENRQRFAESILATSRRMKALVEQLLELAKTENADVRKSFRPVDLGGLVQSSLLTFEPVFFERGLGLESRVDAGMTVSGEAEKLRQAVDILLDNAAKYSRDGGQVRVSLLGCAAQEHTGQGYAARREAAQGFAVGRRRKRRCLLTVESQGQALSPQELKDIFKRFYRADPARSSDGSFGLGLSIAQGIVNQHGGRIWAESRDGVNSFYIELPSLKKESNESIE